MTQQAKMNLLAKSMPVWALFLKLCEIEADAPSSDALDHALCVDTDTLDACALDPVAYHEIDSLASLDDEIDDSSRDVGRMPFDNPIYSATILD